MAVISLETPPDYDHWSPEYDHWSNYGQKRAALVITLALLTWVLVVVIIGSCLIRKENRKRFPDGNSEMPWTKLGRTTSTKTVRHVEGGTWTEFLCGWIGRRCKPQGKNMVSGQRTAFPTYSPPSMAPRLQHLGPLSDIRLDTPPQFKGRVHPLALPQPALLAGEKDRTM